MDMFVSVMIVGGFMSVVGVATIIFEVIEENAERRKKQAARRRRQAAREQAREQV